MQLLVGTKGTLWEMVMTFLVQRFWDIGFCPIIESLWRLSCKASPHTGAQNHCYLIFCTPKGRRIPISPLPPVHCVLTAQSVIAHFFRGFLASCLFSS